MNKIICFAAAKEGKIKEYCCYENDYEFTKGILKDLGYTTFIKIKEVDKATINRG